MALISLQNIRIAFGGHYILDDINLQVESGQRVCLLGRNGAGKSTLMKIIHGSIAADNGEVHREQNIRVAYFSQDIPQDLDGTVFEIIAGGLGTRGQLLLDYHHEEQKITSHPDSDPARFHALHDEIDKYDAWSVVDEINTITSRMDLDSEARYRQLSGGQKRRVLLASALVSHPDLLLLDEPTNHMDIAAIEWLEEYLQRYGFTLLFVTHDRMLLRRLATRIIELDRGQLVDWSCDYDTFLKRKQAVLDAQEKEWERFDKKLAEEEVWIRRGIKARRTRNEGRVRALKKMREERKQRRVREGNVSFSLSDARLSGKIVIDAAAIDFGYPGKEIISDFSTRILRGDKIGIIGPNGCGKTTLINLLLGKVQPVSGEVVHGTNLSIGYFDQLRGQLDEGKSVWKNVLENGETVSINGQDKHIVSYLQDFLFTPERSRTPVSHLSGGERNRLMLAKLFTQPANVLIFDEPTNDLDAETLELLEELLVDFSGTLLVISHDRTFLNNVVTSTLVFTGPGTVEEFVGGYDDWLRHKTEREQSLQPEKRTDKKQAWQEQKKARQKKKLSWNEGKELEDLPGEIEKMETEQAELHERLSDPAIYRNKDEMVSVQSRLKVLEEMLAAGYQRWEELEALQAETE
jgi:ATP-binding cassette subfamily F protein uup